MGVLLDVRGLYTQFFTKDGIVKAVNGITSVSYTHLTLPTSDLV